jgi:hypothetical protein
MSARQDEVLPNTGLATSSETADGEKKTHDSLNIDNPSLADTLGATLGF